MDLPALAKATASEIVVQSVFDGRVRIVWRSDVDEVGAKLRIVDVGVLIVEVLEDVFGGDARVPGVFVD